MLPLKDVIEILIRFVTARLPLIPMPEELVEGMNKVVLPVIDSIIVRLG